MRKRFLVFFVTVLASGCKARNQSQAKYGQLFGRTYPFFTDLPPNNNSILICGVQNLDGYKQANEQWAAAINRKVTVTVQPTCPTEGILNRYGGIIFVTDVGTTFQEGELTGMTVQSERLDAYCPSVVASTAPLVDSMPIFMVKQCSELSIASILHETGHMWGLCDQYDDNTNAPGMHSHCSPRVRSAAVTGDTVMMSDVPGRVITRLFPDDIMGIRTLACLKNVTNEKWMPAIGGHANEAWLQTNGGKSTVEKWEGVFAETARIGADLFLPECIGEPGHPTPAPAPIVPSPVPFFTWAPGEPNDQGHTQNCLAIGPNGLMDENCENEYYFACKSDWNNLLWSKASPDKWEEGEDACKKKTTFTSPQTQDDADSIRGLVDTSPTPLWINLSDEEHEGTYTSEE
ncbi:MAG: hypothetical protein AB7T49_11490 [Oligoflexales bacterium]